MKSYDVIIVGGGPAGISAALTARRYYPDRSVALIRKEEKVIIPCGIPYIFGTVGAVDKNLAPDGVLSDNEINLVINEVSSIDSKKKSIFLFGGETVGYDKLILATGSDPLKVPIPGLDKKNVFFAERDSQYLDSLLKRLGGVKDVVVLGGGFIGIEFADEFKKRSLNVTIVEMLPHCLMLAFDEELCKEAENKLTGRGLNIITGTKIEEILGEDTVTAVRLSDGRELKADIVLVGVGVKPNTNFAEKAGLDVNQGEIVVDSSMKTSDENIFACGDCATKRSFFTKKPSGLRLASIAAIEARIAGANVFNVNRHNPGVVGVFSTIIGDLTLAIAGMTEKTAKEEGFEVSCGYAEAPDRHPGGMPGMNLMKVKLVFDKKTKKILGGQVMGGPSAGEFVNTISACIQNRMKADDIAVFQIGTHPAVTASPVPYPLGNAAEMANIIMMK
ncbi:MAG: NAD(P)/FAD-dependent oxidoreductase [Dissulfuribacterales bacterium]